MSEEKKTWQQESQENLQVALDQFKEKYKGLTVDEAEAAMAKESKAETVRIMSLLQQQEDNFAKALEEQKVRFKGMSVDEAEAIMDRERNEEIAARLAEQRKESK